MSPLLPLLQIKDFFNLVMEKSGMWLHPGPPVTTARIADTNSFAFVELRTPEETDLCLSLGELPFLGTRLKIGRPKGFLQTYGSISSVAAAAMGSAGPGPLAGLGGMGGMSGFGGLSGLGGMGGMGMLGAGGFTGFSGLPGMLGAGGAGGAGLGALGLNTAAGLLGAATAQATAAAAAVSAPQGGGARETLAGVPDDDPTPTDVILAANLAPFLTEAALREVMTPFGPVLACTLLPAPATAATRRALVRYADAGIVPGVIVGLSGLEIGGLHLQVSRAPAGLVARHLGRDALPASILAALPASSSAPGPSGAPTVSLELTNAVLAGELALPQDVTDIEEEISSECSKAGRVVAVVIPALSPEQRARENEPVPIYVVLDSLASSRACAAMLRGRKFDGRTVGVRFATDAEVDAARRPLGAVSASAAPLPASLEDAEDAGTEGGRGGAFRGSAVPPPASFGHVQQAPGSGSAPEDGLALPPVPAAADLD